MKPINKLDELKLLVQEKINECFEISETKFNSNFKMTFKKPTIKYIKTSGKVLGTYTPIRREITLREDLLLECPDLYIENTVPHEFAHHVIFMMFPFGVNGTKKVMPHGKEFKAVCSHFGIDGRATSGAYSKVLDSEMFYKQKRYDYTCSCKEVHKLSQTRHNKISRGTANYLCSVCQTRLKLKG